MVFTIRLHNSITKLLDQGRVLPDVLADVIVMDGEQVARLGLLKLLLGDKWDGVHW